MAGAAAEVLTETDSEYDGGDYARLPTSPARPSIPDGIGNVNGLADLPRGTDSRPPNRPAAEPQIEIADEDRRHDPDDGAREPNSAEADGQNEQRDRRKWREETSAERRTRMRNGRELTKAENARLKNEIEDLRARVSGIEPRLSEFDQSRQQQQLADYDRQIAEAQRNATHARARISEAMIAQDGEALAKALDDRDQAIMGGQQLQVRKNVLETGNPLGDVALRQPPRQAPAQPPPVAPMSREVQAHFRDFQDAHPWYNTDERNRDGSVRDLDTRVALQIDQAVAADGFDPGTPDYWDELDDRMRRYLPHRFERQRGGERQPQDGRPQAGDDRRQSQPRRQAPEQRGPRIAGGSDRAPASTNDRVHISQDRREAMVLAGALDRDGRTVADRTKFNRLVRSYHDYDRLNGTMQ